MTFRKYYIYSIITVLLMLVLTISIHNTIHKNNIKSNWTYYDNCTSITDHNSYTYIRGKCSSYDLIKKIKIELGILNIQKNNKTIICNYCITDQQLTIFYKWDCVHYPYDRTIQLNNIPYVFCSNNITDSCYISDNNDVVFSVDNLPNYTWIFLIISMFIGVILLLIGIKCFNNIVANDFDIIITTLIWNEGSRTFGCTINKNKYIDSVKLIMWHTYIPYFIHYAYTTDVDTYKNNTIFSLLIVMTGIYCTVIFFVSLIEIIQLILYAKKNNMVPLIPIYGIYAYYTLEQNDKNKYNIIFMYLSYWLVIIEYLPLIVYNCCNLYFCRRDTKNIMFSIITFIMLLLSFCNSRYSTFNHKIIYYNTNEINTDNSLENAHSSNEQIEITQEFTYYLE
jgi:hypothetical protein